MISEQELAKLSWPGAPKVITGTIPGPKARAILDKTPEYESIARGGGLFPFIFDEGFGVTVKDPDGNLCIDISAGVAVNSVGRRHPKVIEAAQKQLGKLLHASDIGNTRRFELAVKMSEIAPAGLKGNCISYFTQSGSGAVETAIKFARRATGRSQIVAFHGAYHGVWCGSGALTTGNRYHKGWGPLMPEVIHMPYAYCYRCAFGMKYPSCDLQCAKYVDYVLNTPYTGADDVAAVVIEPQQGEGGYVVPPPGYLEIIKKACEKHGALFVADEIQAGAGRSGKLWSIEHSNVQPDIMTWGKGMGGDLPMAGVCIRKDLVVNVPEGSQPGTFAGNALSAVVCMTNIDIITNPQDELLKRTAEIGEAAKKRISDGSKDLKYVGEVRGRGLFIGIELVKDRETREPLSKEGVDAVLMGMLNRGVLMVPCGRNGNVLRFMPSLTITREYLEKAADFLLETIKGVERKGR